MRCYVKSCLICVFNNVEYLEKEKSQGNSIKEVKRGIPKVVGSNPAVARQILQPARCGLHSE